MKINTINGVKFISFDIFDEYDWIKSCFSTKAGGVSKGYLDSLNLGFRGDSRENVCENYKRICDAVGFSYDGITFSAQEHNTNLKVLDESHKGNGFHKNSEFSNVDGIMTKVEGLVLTTFYADCVPVFFADAQNRAIAISHSGWKGTVGRIAEKTIDKMAEEFGSCIENIKVAIGPAIDICCFEVESPVCDEFEKEFSFFSEFVRKDEIQGKFYIDLKGIINRSLIVKGVPKENIEICKLCTKCNKDLFYSHRRNGLNRGSMAAMMEVNNQAPRGKVSV